MKTTVSARAVTSSSATPSLPFLLLLPLFRLFILLSTLSSTSPWVQKSGSEQSGSKQRVFRAWALSFFFPLLAAAAAPSSFPSLFPSYLSPLVLRCTSFISFSFFLVTFYHPSSALSSLCINDRRVRPLHVFKGSFGVHGRWVRRGTNELEI